MRAKATEIALLAVLNMVLLVGIFLGKFKDAETFFLAIVLISSIVTLILAVHLYLKLCEVRTSGS